MRRRKKRCKATRSEAEIDAWVEALRREANRGDWEAHRRLAETIWGELRGDFRGSAARIAVTYAEHAILRGAYSDSFTQLQDLAESDDPGIRLAAHQLRVHILAACGGSGAGAALEAEFCKSEKVLSILLHDPVRGESCIPAEERQHRAQTCEALLQAVGCRRPEAAGDQPPSIEVFPSFQDQDRAAVLRQTEQALESAPSFAAHLERFIRLRLLWVRLTLDQRPDLCEPILDDVVRSAGKAGYPVLELEARALRAFVRARCGPDRWDEALNDAGRAANLAVYIVGLNRESFLERPLRAGLLSVLDYCLEFLVQGGLAVSKFSASAQDGASTRFGMAMLDYAEHAMQLALTEARLRMQAGRDDLPDAPPASADQLQAELDPKTAVLQYFLFGKYLLTFLYSRNSLVWHAAEYSGVAEESAGPLPVRQQIEPLLAPWAEGAQSRSGRVLLPSWQLPQGRRRHRALCRLLLPEPIVQNLKEGHYTHLAIVPHDVLYRAPFGLLLSSGCGPNPGFSVGLHATGQSACIAVRTGRRIGRRARVGYFWGSGLQFHRHEFVELSCAWGEAAQVRARAPRAQRFQRCAPTCDVVVVACHGGRTERGGLPDAVLDFRPGLSISLSDVSSLNLQRCRLAILQSCWTGWLEHVREDPVQGFPQALLDAGVGAVIAPMFPVADPLCPIFTAVLARCLRFLPVAQALQQSLQSLRTRREQFLCAFPAARGYWPHENTFDDYEYRLTGNPALRLTQGRKERQLQREEFQNWLKRPTLISRCL